MSVGILTNSSISARIERNRAPSSQATFKGSRAFDALFSALRKRKISGVICEISMCASLNAPMS